jgi:hypothetical protein
MRIRTWAGLVPALVLLGGAGCGDEGGSDVTTDVDALVPSKRDYIVQADTICANAAQGIETQAEIAFGLGPNDFTVKPSGEVVFKPGRRPSPGEIERFGSEVVVPAFTDQLEDLRALTPPAGDEDAVVAIYDAADRGVRSLRADPAVFTDSDAVRRELAEARRLGRAYGFFDCGTYAAP